MTSAFVTLNISGVTFTTLRETVLKEPTSRLALLVRGVLPANLDKSGGIFIDRDAKYFQLVLNFLRDGWCSLPRSPDERRELLQEIRYYQLAGFEAWMQTQEIISGNPMFNQNMDRFGSPTAATLSERPFSPATPPRFLQSSYLGSCMSGSAAGSPEWLGAAAGYVSSEPLQSPTAFARASVALANAQQALNSASGGRLGSAPGMFQEATFGPLPSASSSSHFSFSPPTGAGALQSSTRNEVGLSMACTSSSSYSGGTSNPLGLKSSPGTLAAAAAGAGNASGSSSSNATIQALMLPASAADEFKWTTKYMRSNQKLQGVVATLLELAFLPPHRSLHAGKVQITFAAECSHDRLPSLLVDRTELLRNTYQVIRVKGGTGWAYEFSLRPSSDQALFEKYALVEYLQDNWFVLTAVLKDHYGISIEKDTSIRPGCSACRRTNMTLFLQKQF